VTFDSFSEQTGTKRKELLVGHSNSITSQNQIGAIIQFI
jgi:hypothetical protein